MDRRLPVRFREQPLPGPTPPEIVGLAGHRLVYGVFCSESANLTTEQATLGIAMSVLPKFADRVLKASPKQGRLLTECPIWDVGAADTAMGVPQSGATCRC